MERKPLPLDYSETEIPMMSFLKLAFFSMVYLSLIRMIEVRVETKIILLL